MKNEVYYNYIDELNEVFFQNFIEVYNNELVFGGKSNILIYSQNIYQKWIYSPLFTETSLSPANLEYKLNKEYMNGNIFEIPSIRPISVKTFKGFNIDFNIYSLENHPVVNDLEIFLQCVAPRFDLDEEFKFSQKELLKILQKISIFDVFYVEYLLHLSLELGLVEKMPSINVNAFCISRNYNNYFQKSSYKILEDIVGASIKLISYNINIMTSLISSGATIFNENYIKNILLHPSKFNDVFKDVFLLMGIDIEEILLYMDSDKIDIHDEISMTFFNFEILIDKWFVNTFANYLKFIQPLDSFKYDYRTIKKLCIAINNKNMEQIYSNLFSTTLSFSLTSIGAEFFNVDTDMSISDKVFERLTASYITTETLADIANNTCRIVSEFDDELVNVYEFKISVLDEEEYWRIIEIKGTSCLQELHIEICRNFGLSFELDYSFYLDENFNPFTEYTSPKNKRIKNKKTDKTLINDLKLYKKQKLVYKAFNEEYSFGYENNASIETLELMLKIELINIKNNIRGISYPRSI